MKKVVGFFGGDAQVGTSMIAQSFAEMLASRGKKVLLVLGSGKYGDTAFLTGSEHSLDDVKAAIRSGNIEREELLQNLEKKKGVWVIPGVRNPFLTKYFPENSCQVLLEPVKDDFDYAVIDGGCDYHLGLVISALNVSDCRFYITTQQAKSIARFGFCQKQIFRPLNLPGHLVVNKYMKDPALFLKADVLKFCEAADGGVIPYIEYGWQAEMEGSTLLQYRPFYKAIEKLLHIVEPEGKKERKWKRNSV